VVKNYEMVKKLYRSGWKYIVYKLLAYGFLNNLDKLVRYCDKLWKVFKSRIRISTQVKVVLYHARELDNNYSRLYMFTKIY
jgi:hypothetical protein